MRQSSHYTKKYYQSIQSTSINSARELVPLIVEFIRPKSLADVGCGTGIWLSEWERYGISDYIGIDGEYIAEEQLSIPKEKFLKINLDEAFSLPRKFEMLMCLEVAEHIQPSSAKTFIESICKLSDVILFSAAIPGQGGMNHQNEQYRLLGLTF